ncbi:hypothetical protein EV363DRAFT_1392200 [Boletus edulis]|nr:hypothetical protein EV363DRAFT_1392200 [Boletus edulis]
MYPPSSRHPSSALGRYYFMQDDLQNAYSAYQQALFLLPKPKDPKLWYQHTLRLVWFFGPCQETICVRPQGKYDKLLSCFVHIL